MKYTTTEYMNRIVCVDTDQEKHKHVPYLGRLAYEDEHSIKLKPVVSFLSPRACGSLRQHLKELNSTKDEVILGRGIISKIELITSKS